MNIHREIEESITADILRYFPEQVRDEISIGPGVAGHNHRILLLHVRATLADSLPLCDTNGLAKLIDAESVEHRNGELVLSGMYKGEPCEITLVAPHSDN